jgi:hypothetical protein
LFIDERPRLKHGNLLTARHIALLDGFPRDMAALVYAGFGDGVLHGCRVYANESAVTVEPGVIFRKGVFYRMCENRKLTYESAEHLQYVKAVFAGGRSADADGVETQEAAIVIDALAPEDGQFELARFKLKRGARLRSDYTDFYDLNTEYDTIDLTHAPHACRTGVTLSPFITDYYAREAFGAGITDPADAAFCMLCLQSGCMDAAVISGYLGESAASPAGLYAGLAARLGRIGGGKAIGRGAGRTRRIAVD